MKSVRPEFTEEEYAVLKQDADRLGVTVKQLARDKVLGIVTEDTPLCSTNMVCDEIAKNREVLNQIIRREVEGDEHLFEDDIIRIEMAMDELEEIVAAYVREQLREAKRHG